MIRSSATREEMPACSVVDDDEMYSQWIGANFQGKFGSNGSGSPGAGTVIMEEAGMIVPFPACGTLNRDYGAGASP